MSSRTQETEANATDRRFYFSTTWRKSFKVSRVFALAAFNITCNIVVLYAVFHTYRFDGIRWITENKLLSIIEFTAKLPVASTVVITRLTVSHLWSRKLAHILSDVEFAELQSLNVLSPILAIPRVLAHIVSRRYVFAGRSYLLMVFSAILLQFYSTAIVTLATPALILVKEPIHGRATADVGRYNGTKTWSEDGSYPQWTKVDITFDSEDANKRLIVGAIPLGPMDGVGVKSGVLMTGLNMATIERLLGMKELWDSAEFTIQVGTTAPLLTCRCQKGTSDNTSTVTIGVDTYNLVTPIPLLQHGEAVGQVTSNNRTLILSLGNQPPTSTTHCAIDLTFTSMDITIQGSSPRPGIPSSVITSPSLHPWELGKLPDPARVEPSSIRDFFDDWLGGIGWSTSPKSSDIASVLASHPIVTDIGGDHAKNGSYLEYHLLAMFAHEVSIGFPPERPPSLSTSKITANKKYRVIWEYYIGLRTRFQAFLAFVIIFDCVFVIWCLAVITQDE
ncbi:hypothetical protein NLI96_g2224 [Meripilus lineatus]|uniref:Uncharacterized protein n=1 Tax=Meripilus lineatus TaxID=2056292 RepID=A0AAD5YM70_9APHY|nr:hypothetical protein NLI96_g2224 [Physisporinus lineatus]